MMNDQEIQEEQEALFSKFYKYLLEFEELKKQYRKEARYKTYIRHHASINTMVAGITRYKGHLIPYIREMITILEGSFASLSKEKRVSLLYKLFDDFDVALSNPANNFGTGLDLYLDGKIFINTSNFWRSDFRAKPPHSPEDPFESFGICRLPGQTRVENMSDIIERLSKGKNPFLDGLRKVVRIGLFPLSDRYRFKLKFTDVTNPGRNTWGFLVDQLDFPDFKEELDAVIQCIKDNKVHIAIFPELLICDQTIGYIKSRLEELNMPFFLLIAGSFHRLSEGDMKNIMPITLFMQGGKQEYSYAKLEKFNMRADHFITKHRKYEQEQLTAILSRLFSNPENMFWAPEEFVGIANLEEDITDDDSLLILNFKEIGSIGFLICKDLLQNPNTKLPAYMQLVDHMFVASMNSSVPGDFKNDADMLIRQHKISCFYVNARSSDPDYINPTFYQTPIKADYQTIKPDKPWLIYDLKVKEGRISQI